MLGALLSYSRYIHGQPLCLLSFRDRNNRWLISSQQTHIVLGCRSAGGVAERPFVISG